MNRSRVRGGEGRFITFYFIIFYTVMLGQKVFCPLVSLNSLYYETDLFICQEENVYFYAFSL